MENLIANASQYGALGLTVLASFWYINKKDKDHSTERNDFYNKFEILHRESLEVTKANNEALLKLSVIIQKN